MIAEIKTFKVYKHEDDDSRFLVQDVIDEKGKIFYKITMKAEEGLSKQMLKDITTTILKKYIIRIVIKKTETEVDVLIINLKDIKERFK